MWIPRPLASDIDKKNWTHQMLIKLKKTYPPRNKHIPLKGNFQNFPFTAVGYVSSLEGTELPYQLLLACCSFLLALVASWKLQVFVGLAWMLAGQAILVTWRGRVREKSRSKGRNMANVGEMMRMAWWNIIICMFLLFTSFFWFWWKILAYQVWQVYMTPEKWL